MTLVSRSCSSLITALALLVCNAAAEQPVTESQRSAPAKDHDAAPYGGPLPAGALLRIGTPRFLLEHEVKAVAFSPDRKAVVAAGHWRNPGSTVIAWDLTSGKVLRRLRDRVGEVRALRFSSNGNPLLIASRP